MKTTTDVVKTVTVELTAKEAEWLKDMMQNGDDPTKEIANFRQDLFNHLRHSITFAG